MTKAKLLLVLAFILVCAAGVVVGTAVDRQVRPPAPPSGKWDPLHLTPSQRTQMQAIWEPVNQMRGQIFHQRHQYDLERTSKILALLSPDQLVLYNQIEEEYEKENHELDVQLHQLIQKAEQDTRSILTAEQLAAFDQARKSMPHGGGPGMGSPGMGPGIGPPRHHDRSDRGDHEHRRSTSQPTTQPDAGPV